MSKSPVRDERRPPEASFLVVVGASHLAHDGPVPGEKPVKSPVTASTTREPTRHRRRATGQPDPVQHRAPEEEPGEQRDDQQDPAAGIAIACNLVDIGPWPELEKRPRRAFARALGRGVSPPSFFARGSACRGVRATRRGEPRAQGSLRQEVKGAVLPAGFLRVAALAFSSNSRASSSTFPERVASNTLPAVLGDPARQVGTRGRRAPTASRCAAGGESVARRRRALGKQLDHLLRNGRGGMDGVDAVLVRAVRVRSKLEQELHRREASAAHGLIQRMPSSTNSGVDSPARARACVSSPRRHAATNASRPRSSTRSAPCSSKIFTTSG